MIDYFLILFYLVHRLAVEKNFNYRILGYDSRLTGRNYKNKLFPAMASPLKEWGQAIIILTT